MREVYDELQKGPWSQEEVRSRVVMQLGRFEATSVGPGRIEGFL